MATPGDEHVLSSDQVYDFACSSCEEDNVNTEAQFSCKECENYLCNKCIKLHNKLFKKHEVLGRSDVTKWVRKKCETSLEKCEKHPEESVKMVCEDHDELCCSLCVSLSHRMCRSIRLIDDLAKGVKNTDQLKDLTQRVKAINTELITMKKKRLSNKKALQDSDKNLVQDIKTIREKFLASLQELEIDIGEEMDTRKDIFVGKLQEDVTQCTEMHDKLIKTLGYSQSDDERMSYIGYRRCQEQVKDAEISLNKMSKIPEYKLSFKIEKDLDNLFDSLKSVGKVVSTPSFDECDSKPEQFVHDTKTETSSTTARKCYDPNYAFTTKATHIHNLRIKDEKPCSIKGICELQTGEIVLADCANNKMKVLSREFKIVTTLNLPQHTENMCIVGGNEVALAVDDAKKKHEVHFITIDKFEDIEAKSISKFAVAHNCNAVSFHNDYVYVGSESSVYMYSKDGIIVKQVYHKLGWSQCTVNGIHTSNNGQKIYITDSSNNKVITVDNSGKILSTCEDPDLLFPVSLCVSEHGHLFVCAMGSNSVLQIDKEGRRKLRTLVSGEKVSKPLVVYFSTRSQQLMVAGNTNDLLVADLI
ncbi:E3 ubiquitin-protein ligase Midline-1-like [Mya arenaria]|uniref:E3 ubiquitin-protein ligase Midline-1-like n=1 Tax=Mya arenaria TaxID=6604 RepID=UPI0022E99138|nr:E3 ubiquitin-protein ligase Midline-1-like [Mya arenaria]